MLSWNQENQRPWIGTDQKRILRKVWKAAWRGKACRLGRNQRCLWQSSQDNCIHKCRQFYLNLRMLNRTRSQRWFKIHCGLSQFVQQQFWPREWISRYPRRVFEGPRFRRQDWVSHLQRGHKIVPWKTRRFSWTQIIGLRNRQSRQNQRTNHQIHRWLLQNLFLLYWRRDYLIRQDGIRRNVWLRENQV